MKQFLKNKKIVLLLIFLGIFFASGVFALQAEWPKSPTGIDLAALEAQDKLDLTIFIKYLYEWGITIGGLSVFIVLILAGFQYLTSGGNPTAIKEAIDKMRSAAFGLLLLLGSWLILNTINPELTTLHSPDFNLSGLKVPDIIENIDDTKEKPCEFAYLYKAVDWKGKYEKITPEDNAKDVNSWVGKAPESVKSFRTLTTITDDDGNITSREMCIKPLNSDKGEDYYEICTVKQGQTVCEKELKMCVSEGGQQYVEGGACYLELFGGTALTLGLTCGDKINDVPGSVDDLSKHRDKKINCVRLVLGALKH